jgi:hypothetical protein
MDKKLRITAPDLTALRNFLAGADLDFGCRPVARREGGGYVTIVIANNDQLERLNARRSATRAQTVEIEVVEELPDPMTKLRLVQRAGSRFAGGRLPHGLGRKE